MSRKRRALLSVVILGLSLLSQAASASEEKSPITTIHKPGYCAIRGQCGKKSFFGSELPCPDNGPAKEPDAKVREQLVELCGDEWKEGLVCCEQSQLKDLASNLKRAGSIISSCPACKANFFNLFCSFTCSPDQSLFVNVTEVDQSTSKMDIVSELSYFVSEEYGKGFYDSCKDVKFSATNGYVMDFIGGGAKNYTAFLKFLGDKKPFGSPFQINFPREVPDGITQFQPAPKKCNDDDVNYRCACVDCPSVCGELPPVEEAKFCMVGSIPCLSLIVMVIYTSLLLALIFGHIGYAWYKRHQKSKSDRLRLLQDPGPSDDDDEGEFIDPSGYGDRRAQEYKLNRWLDNIFSTLGTACATFPGVTIAVAIFIVGVLSLGWLQFSVEKDPVRLWVAPNSNAAQEKAFFDENFGPFYRANQAFLVNDTGPVLTYDHLSWWFDVEDRIRRLKSDKGLVLEDVCFKPTGIGCVVQSVTGYFANDFGQVDPFTWKDDLKSCAELPFQQQCLPEFQQPLKKQLILGGWQDSGDVTQAKSLIVTWVVNNYAEGTKELARSMDWEQALKGQLLAIQEEAKDRGLRLSFSTEVSLEQELNKSTNTDAKIIVVSYIAMFLYASMALGSASLTLRTLLMQPSKALVESKFTLGISGILIVLMSVSASVGLFSALGVKVTLIIAEVIPFLVLAIGVDNIFLIVHEFERANFRHPDEAIETRVGRALGRMGPSILLSASTETIAFGLGAIVSMPAVRNFAIYAAGAVFINAVLQVTMFVAVLALNEQRVEAGRMDCFPCIKISGCNDCGNGSLGDMQRGTSRGVGGRGGYGSEVEGLLEGFIRRTYAPWLLKRRTKAIILVLFLGLFSAGISLIPEVELGLDQRIALPSDSYLINYFDDLDDYLDIGPPVYFVTREFNATQRENQQALCGRFSKCDPFSIANVLEQERKRPEVSYIAEPAASWIDDYMHWLNPELETCCRINKRTGNACSKRERPSNCKVCFADRDQAWSITLSGMPQGEEFINYLGFWIDAPTDEECPLSGKAPYANALVIDKERLTVNASHFRTSHTSMKSQRDFIEAYASARRIAKEISDKNPQGIKVFPYSKFYIFFDQYATIQELTASLVSTALFFILIVSSILLGSLKTALCIGLTVLMIVVDILGAMALVGVSLNAVSLVNLVICVGIGVEFCAHIARAFMFPNRSIYDLAKFKYKFRSSRDARAWTALVNVGGSVFTGITVTKLIGVAVLAFTRSKIFEIYYFRMWALLILMASTHALIFLPVLLSVWGSDEGYAPDDGEGLEDDLRARFRAPYLAGRVGRGYDEDGEETESGDDDENGDEDEESSLLVWRGGGDGRRGSEGR